MSSPSGFCSLPRRDPPPPLGQPVEPFGFVFQLAMAPNRKTSNRKMKGNEKRSCRSLHINGSMFMNIAHIGWVKQQHATSRPHQMHESTTPNARVDHMRPQTCENMTSASKNVRIALPREYGQRLPKEHAHIAASLRNDHLSPDEMARPRLMHVQKFNHRHRIGSLRLRPTMSSMCTTAGAPPNRLRLCIPQKVTIPIQMQRLTTVDHEDLRRPRPIRRDRRFPE